jgi:excisionase family DNA binding protein
MMQMSTPTSDLRKTISFDQLPNEVFDLRQEVASLRQLLEANFSQRSANADDTPWSIDQASKFVNLSIPTIYGLVSRKEIPVSKKGKRLYFSKSALLEWINSGKKKTVSEIQLDGDLYLQTKKKA